MNTKLTTLALLLAPMTLAACSSGAGDRMGDAGFGDGMAAGDLGEDDEQADTGAADEDAEDDTEAETLGQADDDHGDAGDDDDDDDAGTGGQVGDDDDDDDDDDEAGTGGQVGDDDDDDDDDDDAGTGGQVGDDDDDVGETGLEEGETGLEEGETGEAGMQAPADGDFIVNPAVWAQFRQTAGAPVVVTEPIDIDDPIDVQGLRYENEVSHPGDADDWLEFRIVPGLVDPTITFSLDCDDPDLFPQPLRAHLLDEDENVLDTVVCGDGPANVTLDDASSTDQYFVHIELLDMGESHYTEYGVELDAFCFGGCDYQPL